MRQQISTAMLGQWNTGALAPSWQPAWYMLGMFSMFSMFGIFGLLGDHTGTTTLPPGTKALLTR